MAARVAPVVRGRETSLAGAPPYACSDRMTVDRRWDAAGMFDLLPGAAWATDAQGGILHRNPAAADLLGDEGTLIDRVHPEDRPAVERLGRGADAPDVIRFAAGAGGWQRYEVRCRREASGPAVWLATPLAPPVVSEVQRGALDLFPSPVLLVELGTARVIYANQAADDLAGGDFAKDRPAEEYDLAYHCRYPDGTRIPASGLPGVLVAQGRRVHAFEMIWDTPGGERHLLVYGDTLPGHGNAAPTVGLIVFNDVTELKRRSQGERLAAQRFSMLVEQAPFSIQLLGTDGRTTKVNRAFVALWGIRFEELADYNLLEDPQLEAAGIAPAIRRAFAGGGPERMPAIPYRPDRGDRLGSEIWTQALIYPVQDDAGRVLEVVLVHQDVTDARMREQALREQAGQLERTNADLQQFVYVTTHDLQEPLRMVQSFLDLLVRRHASDLPSQARDYVDRAMTGAGRMHDLVQGLLRLTRAAEAPFDARVVEVRAVLDEVVGLLQGEIEASAARIEIDPLPTVAADRALLATVLQNLLSNAIKYRRGPPRIRIGGIVRGSACELVVEDDGVGIPEEARHRIFQPFQRLQREVPGAGIGLALCARLIARQGGRISIDGNAAGGSTFRVTLPVPA